MINIPGINSVVRTTSPGANLGIVPRALGIFIDPYHPQGFKGNITGSDIEDAQYPCLAPGVNLVLQPWQKIGNASAQLYTSPTKYYTGAGNGGASIEANSPYYYQGNASGAGGPIGHFSIWLKPDSTITKSSSIQVPIQLEYHTNTDGLWYIGLGSSTGLLTDEYISITDTGFEDETNTSGPKTNRRTGVKTGGALTGGVWVNISFNWNSSLARYDIFVNNVECSDYITSTGNYSGHVKQHYAQNYHLTLGAVSGGRDNNGVELGGRAFFNGKISAYTQYTDSLTPQEMTQNFNYFKSRFGL